MHHSSTAFSLTNVCVQYGDACALQGISVTIPAATLMAVVGPNGGGKSTFLKAIMGIVPTSCGKILFTPSSLKRHMAYLPQKSQVDHTFPITVYDAVAMGLWREIGAFRAYPKDAHKRIRKALEEVGMDRFSTRALKELSGGELQRILFARLILQDAKIILLDEPFNNLDQPTIQDLIRIILKWHETGKTVLVVLHDLDLVREYFPRCLLVAGHVIACGATKTTMTLDHLSKAFALSRNFGKAFSKPCS